MMMLHLPGKRKESTSLSMGEWKVLMLVALALV